MLENRFALVGKRLHTWDPEDLCKYSFNGGSAATISLECCEPKKSPYPNPGATPRVVHHVLVLGTRNNMRMHAFDAKIPINIAEDPPSDKNVITGWWMDYSTTVLYYSTSRGLIQ
jgi:hypothetical protein